MNVILPRYAGAIAESVVSEPGDMDVAPAINTAAAKSDGLGCHAGAGELRSAAGRDI